jgi:hypothetical protein
VQDFDDWTFGEVAPAGAHAATADPAPSYTPAHADIAPAAAAPTAPTNAPTVPVIAPAAVTTRAPVTLSPRAAAAAAANARAAARTAGTGTTAISTSTGHPARSIPHAIARRAARATAVSPDPPAPTVVAGPAAANSAIATINAAAGRPARPTPRPIARRAARLAAVSHDPPAPAVVAGPTAPGTISADAQVPAIADDAQALIIAAGSDTAPAAGPADVPAPVIGSALPSPEAVERWLEDTQIAIQAVLPPQRASQISRVRGPSIPAAANALVKYVQHLYTLDPGSHSGDPTITEDEGFCNSPPLKAFLYSVRHWSVEPAVGEGVGRHIMYEAIQVITNNASLWLDTGSFKSPYFTPLLDNTDDVGRKWKAAGTICALVINICKGAPIPVSPLIVAAVMLTREEFVRLPFALIHALHAERAARVRPWFDIDLDAVDLAPLQPLIEHFELDVSELSLVLDLMTRELIAHHSRSKLLMPAKQRKATLSGLNIFYPSSYLTMITYGSVPTSRHSKMGSSSSTRG